MKFPARRRQPLALPALPPIPLDAMGLALQAAGRRGDELLGPALRQLDERSKLSQRFALVLAVLAVATVCVLHWLHPEWTFRALAASLFNH
ncbi:hypothetical protein FNT36_24790 [Hymenobacter setariae]|uniref:Uncharacterized protein n=1 Tax=Hymenobacter setariae TaxID=2594794 RepID=A0A558BJQ9_9BACT|nr:hypothetical protein [Hymenobacter setariae]TVT36733.1 hypothetical protein FNT36_24790 [Hymenobacter setariae]